jgi:putative addiction module component (TIGR02574 family)
MNARTKKLLEEARELPASEREILVAELGAELDAEAAPPEIAKAWDEEIRRRIDDVVAGRTKTIDMHEAMAQLRARHARR